MNKTDWTEQLRKRMERQEEPVDDSLWAGIEQALDSPSVGKRPAHGLSLRRWIAAAAVLLGLVAGSVYWLSRHGEQADRKSTRLNSSHANISYAVFCLKKKKNY